MKFKEILNLINDSDQPLTSGQLLDLVMPPKIDGSSYSLDEIEVILREFYDQIELAQRCENERFDSILDEATSEGLRNLCEGLSNTQMDAIRLQCDIAQTRERLSLAKGICNSEKIIRRRELIEREKHLRTILRQSKFKPIQSYFNLFIEYLTNSSRSFDQQSFDWANYHRIMFLLRACGKTMQDITKFERLYQSGCNFIDLTFKQPLNDMDFNNYVEFQTTYNLETQLEIVFQLPAGSQFTPTIGTQFSGGSGGAQLPAEQVKCDFGQFQCHELISDLFSTNQPVAHELFLSEFDRLRSATIEFCRILVDMNLYYIEANLTEGINIDRLNAVIDTSNSNEAAALPAYAFSPQEYVTQIGQHLLTLRKQTEQYSQTNNEPLKLALEYLEQAQSISLVVKTCKSITEIILKCIARHCLRSFVGRTSNSIISRLTSNGRRQLATDAMYLDNVLEDLGLLSPSEPNYEKFKSLLTH